MDKLREAARQVVDAWDLGEFSTRMDEAITALREALAEQAEQDLDTCPGCGGVADNGHDREFPPNPYYCTKCTEQAEQEPVCIDWDTKTDEPIMGYAAPVRTRDLTDEDLCKIGEAHALGMECEGYENNMLWYEVNPLPAFRAAIAADREKNK